jgi:demethylmenaquinone methyltransferase/2-methoxy-6-polyprenyl-1,4-benzoquinol methylase
MIVEQKPTVERLAPHPPLTGFYRAPDQRAQFVGELFDRAAADYNWICRVMSLGTDRHYRKHALRKAGLRPGMKVLDVATGTGLMAQAAFDLGIPAVGLFGVDPSQGMLRENRRRRPIYLMQGTGEALPIRDATFDFVVMGYALRHVEDLAELFGEFHRVLRDGGRALLLEITRPSSRLGFALMRLCVQRILPFLTRLGTRREAPARLVEYYWATIAECVPPGSILGALSAAGFTGVQRMSTGTVLSEYVADKPGRLASSGSGIR